MKRNIENLFRGICTQAPCYCIVMEYCSQGQLYEVLRNGRQITANQLIDWARQIADGMNYLHQFKIIHRDLKSPKYTRSFHMCLISWNVMGISRFEGALQNSF